MRHAASKSEPLPFVVQPLPFAGSFCDRFRAHIAQLADDEDATFVNACTSRYSPFRTFVQNALGSKETPDNSVVSHVAHSQDLAAIRKDVVTLVQCMDNEQLIDLLCTALPHFKRLWLSADTSSFEARRRLLQEVDQLTFETALTLMAESSRFRLIALECNDRHQLNLEIEKGAWERIKQLIKYLLGKPDAKSATAATTAITLQIKVLFAIFLGGGTAVVIHHHIVVKSHPPALVMPVISPSPAISLTVPAAPPSPAISLTIPAAAPSPAIGPTVHNVAPPKPPKARSAEAHKPAGPEKTADAQKHSTPAHIARKDNPIPTKDAEKTVETPKTDVAQKDVAHKNVAQKKGGVFGFLKKAAVGDTTETDKESAPPSKSTTETGKQSAPPAKSTDTQTNTNTQKKGGLFGFLKKNKHNNDKTNSNTNTNNDKTTNDVTK